MDKKLKSFLRKEMMKLNKVKPTKSSPKHFHWYVKGFDQAKFDLLMDIDQKFQLGAFYKKGKTGE